MPDSSPPPAPSPATTPARRKIRDALRARGYEPREIVWNGAFSLVDWGSDGGFSVDGFGSFASADDFVAWIEDEGNYAAFLTDTEYLRDDASTPKTEPAP